MIWALLLFVAGLSLSAFFSGSETGFYRVPQVRLLIDALDGNWRARALLWLTNHPSLFVATTLVGNNAANYITSFSIVIMVAYLIPSGGAAAELAAPLIFAPVLFIYGELLPKNLYFHAPNRLLRIGGPMFLFFTVLLLPVSVLLWLFSLALEWLLGASPQKVQLTLARQELRRVLDEGGEAGVLRPVQRQIAHNMFDNANLSLASFIAPLNRLPCLASSGSKQEALDLARRHGLSDVLIADSVGDSLAGYVNVAELALSTSETLSPVRSLMSVPERDTYLATLIAMQSAEQVLAQVLNARGETIGVVNIGRLRQPLLEFRV